MKALITGGGTGGHIYPALSVAKKLDKEGWEILFIGSEEGLETEIVPEEDLKLLTVPAGPLPRRITVKILFNAVKSSRGFFQARRIVKKFAPDVVLGTGGYVTGPVVMAAGLSGVSSVIHEQNVYPGVTNRLLAYSAERIALNFEEAIKHFPGVNRNKFVVTGNPIREVILKTSGKEGREKLALSPGKKTVLVFGGSQGARSINEAMITVCNYFCDKPGLQVVYITGRKNYRQISKQIECGKNIKIMPYLNNIEWAYAAADLVVYRAGATGLAEITARGLPAILIPYPHAAGNHQEFNARNMEQQGAAEIIKDRDLSGELLAGKIRELINDEKRLARMSRNSKKLGRPGARENLIRVMKDLV